MDISKTVLIIAGVALITYIAYKAVNSIVNQIGENNTSFMEECLQHEKEWTCKALLRLDAHHNLRHRRSR